MQNFTVSGMSCAACSSKVEKTVSKIEGVTSCAVNLLTGEMAVEGDVLSADIIYAVEKAGYGARLKGEKAKTENREQEKDKTTKKIIIRLSVSAVFLVLLMYCSMGHTMLGWKLPAFFERNPLAVATLQMLLSAIIMVINQKFFINGFLGLLRRSPNMDTLVSLGSGAAFIYSVCILFAMTDALQKGDIQALNSYIHELYFESAAMVLVIITLGKLLESFSKGKTVSALKELMKLSPQTANVIRDGKEITLPIDKVVVNDVFTVRPGESISLDGVVIEGESAVNESVLTGESIPVDKKVGSSVSAATLNQSGFLKCRATRVGDDTAIAQIIKTVNNALTTKAPIAKIADKVSGIFVPCVIGISIITLFSWLISGQSIGFALARSVSVLVISCPCALGIATPVSIMVASGKGAKNGILFKTAVSLEQMAKVKTVALDKTGTLTNGTPEVTDVLPSGDISETELLILAASLEKKSEHPLAKAIIKKAENFNAQLNEVTDFKILAGNGLCAVYNEKELCGGNAEYIGAKTKIPNGMLKSAEKLSAEGKTPMYFSYNGELIGIIAVADTVRDDSRAAVAELRSLGMKVVMITGDNERTANAIAAQVGIENVYSGILPNGKAEVVEKLKSEQMTAMAGDGVNDAPALVCADLGIAIGAGTDVAIDSADVVLMKNSLSDVCAAVKLARATLRNIKENLFWAFIYNVVGIPLAAGVWIFINGWEMNPMFGAMAMSLSSVCVVSNALRLNLAKIKPKENIKKENNKKINRKGRKKMKTEIKVEGMMCPRCEAHVKKALEAIEGVSLAEASHEKGIVTVTLTKDIPTEVLEKAITDEGYSVIK
ncbi:MAG: heavy metal translocating P-type ATPase [Ruminococcaceae bacterium]|nr:heavy metal translocating P-type ATPase [Oscillospiraceae bacterium]